MVVEFSDQHKIAFDPKDGSVLSPYAYGYHNRTKIFSQLSVCITGTPEFIKNKLKKMLSEMEGEAAKPAQGQLVTTSGDICEVITNVWEGVKLNIPKEEVKPVLDQVVIAGAVPVQPAVQTDTDTFGPVITPEGLLDHIVPMNQADTENQTEANIEELV